MSPLIQPVLPTLYQYTPTQPPSNIQPHPVTPFAYRHGTSLSLALERHVPGVLSPHLCCLATLEQRLPTVARFARSAPAPNSCIAFAALQGMQAIQHPHPRRSQ